jgi:indolepyruvate ferredoxin oxidoreductase beta subunit
MGDGRYDDERLRRAIAAHSRAQLLFNMDAVAKSSGAMINAVMLGAIAGCGRLPLPAEACETAIRADGKAVEANLRGFRAGLAAAQRCAPPDAGTARDALPPIHASALSMLDGAAAIPEIAREIVRLGLERLTGYQDEAYARLYLDRLAPICKADTRTHAGGRLAAAVARNLAVRMSYEDVIRVAEAKIAPQRFVRIAEEVGAGPNDPIIVVDYLKPGVEEICQLLPPRLARRILALAERRGWLGRLYFGMEVKTSSISGYLRFWLLAKLRPWRRRSFRYAQ